MKTIFKIFIVLTSTLLVLFFLTSCQQGTSKTDPHAAEVIGEDAHQHDGEADGEISLEPEVMEEVGIEVAELKRVKFHGHKSFPGTVVPQPDGEAHIGTLVGGRVIEILVHLGQLVQKGDPLCKIESPEIGMAQANYIRTLASYQLAHKEYERQKALRQQDIGSEKSFLEKEANFEQALAELTAAKRTLLSFGFTEEEINKLKNDHRSSGVLTLRSPIKGTITDWNLHIGQRVDLDHDLFHVVDLSRLWVKIAIYEKDLPVIKCEQNVEIIPQSFPTKVYTGKIARIAGEIDPDMRTIDCYIQIDKPDAHLIPLLFVSANVCTGDESREALAIPEDALILDQHGDKLVFVEHEPNHFITKEVETGINSGGWIEVLDGLQEGERVVFKGAFFLKSEMGKGSFGHGHAH